MRARTSGARLDPSTVAVLQMPPVLSALVHESSAVGLVKAIHTVAQHRAVHAVESRQGGSANHHSLRQFTSAAVVQGRRATVCVQRPKANK